MTLVRNTPVDQILYGPNLPVRMRNLSGMVLDITSLQDAVDSLQTGTEAVPLVTTDTTQSTSSTTGSIIGAGGLGIAKDAFIAGNLYGKSAVIAGTAYASPTVLTAAQSGATCLLNAAAGNVFTLPAATAANAGIRFKFIQTATVTSNAAVIQGATSSDLFVAGSSAMQFVVASPTIAIYSPNGSSNYKYSGNGTTTGGIIGDVIEVICTGLNAWQVNAVQTATGSVATPFIG